MSLETKRNVLKRFGAPTTISIIERVEQHDDLYRSHREMFLESVLTRSIPSVFHEYINTWPTTKVKSLKWDDTFIFSVAVHYEHWDLTRELDAKLFWTDKQAFCDKLDELVREMSQTFIDEKESGRPWWNGRERYWSLGAHHKIGDRVYYGITSRLAEIKHRGGKYHWHLIPDKYGRDDWDVKEHKQGHANTLDEAKAACLAAWKGTPYGKIGEKGGEESNQTSGGVSIAGAV